MSKILNTVSAIVIVGLFAMGTAQARVITHNQPQPGYAGQMYAAAPIAHFVPGRGVVGESCDLPTSACSNDERISN
jgi:hypothetical protein